MLETNEVLLFLLVVFFPFASICTDAWRAMCNVYCVCFCFSYFSSSSSCSSVDFLHFEFLSFSHFDFGSVQKFENAVCYDVRHATCELAVNSAMAIQKTGMETSFYFSFVSLLFFAFYLYFIVVFVILPCQFSVCVFMILLRFHIVIVLHVELVLKMRKKLYEPEHEINETFKATKKKRDTNGEKSILLSKWSN